MKKQPKCHYYVSRVLAQVGVVDRSTLLRSTHSESVASVSDSKHESSYVSSSLGDIRPPQRKNGKFRSSWRLPPHITASSNGGRFAFCKVCTSNFCISHGGFNDKKTRGRPVHKRKLNEIDGNLRIDSFILDKTHAKKVMSAELMIWSNSLPRTIFLSKLPIISDLFTKMFPDSRIAVDFRCKHTKIIDILYLTELYIYSIYGSTIDIRPRFYNVIS